MSKSSLWRQALGQERSGLELIAFMFAYADNIRHNAALNITSASHLVIICSKI